MAPVCGLRIDAEATERMRQATAPDPRRGRRALRPDRRVAT